MSRISIIKVILCFLLIIISGCLPAISAENVPLESDHPYANNYDHTWTIKEPGATKMRLHFDYLKLAKDEKSYGSGDKLIILDKYGNKLKTYAAHTDGINYEDYWTAWYPGDTLQVELVTDESRICDGFVIDKKGVRQGEGVTSDSSVESDHPYQNNYEDEWNISEPGATKIRLHFEYLKLAKDEKSYGSGDKLIILDKYGNKLKTYAAYTDGINYGDYWTAWYPGDTLQVELVTDESRICDGFVIDKKEGSNETNSSSESIIGDSKNTVPKTQSEGTGTGENKVLTTTELTSSSNPSTLGQPVTLTAEVDIPSQETKEPSGTVTFMDGTTAIGTKDLTSGHATLITSKLSGGSHSITAEYSGGNNFEPSTSSSFPLTVQDDNSNPSAQDDNSNPSDHPDSPFTLDNISKIAGIISTIVGIIVATRKFL